MFVCQQFNDAIEMTSTGSYGLQHDESNIGGRWDGITRLFSPNHPNLSEMASQPLCVDLSFRTREWQANRSYKAHIAMKCVVDQLDPKKALHCFSLFLGPGSAKCSERKPCTVNDYIETHSACDENNKVIW